MQTSGKGLSPKHAKLKLRDSGRHSLEKERVYIRHTQHKNDYAVAMG